MIFQNRQGSNLNRKRLRIISQTAEEMIVDVERADSPIVEGTPINASTMNQFQSEIDTANSNASTALTTANTASQDASTALSTAGTASQDASDAVTTANEAKTIALYVESQLADRGATVKFNGVAQTEVNFSSDPQTQINNKLSLSAVLDITYPVGSIYMSVNSASPATLFGGTWEQIENRFLLSAGSSYTAGATGGEASHTLTISEMPSHNHTFTGNSTYYQFGDVAYGTISASNQNVSIVDGADNYGKGGTYSTKMKDTGFTVTSSGTIENKGGSSAHNNMPPYLVVYMWKRIN